MDTFKLEVITPEGIIFQDQVTAVTLPTAVGEITILPHHTALFAKVTDGEIKIKKGNTETSLVITGGFVEVSKNSTTIVSDYAIRAESIEIARAMEAKKRAEELLHERRGKQEFLEAEKELKKSLLELKVAERVRRKQRVQP